MKRDKSRNADTDQTDLGQSQSEWGGAEQTRVGGQEMSQRVEGVLGASGLRSPAVASLEGGSGLFILTDEQLLFHDGHGTRRVTLRDLARIHSDAEGTLRVETPAGVAMSASLIGFDGDAVQQFFGQVRDVTARVKSLTSPPPLTSAPPVTSASPVTSPPALRPPSRSAAPAPRAEATPPDLDPDQGVSVTAVRRPEPEVQHFSGPAPTITVNRRGQREDLADEAANMRGNALGLSASGGADLERNLPPAGSVEIRAVRKPSLTAPTAPELGGSGADTAFDEAQIYGEGQIHHEAQWQAGLPPADAEPPQQPAPVVVPAAPQPRPAHASPKPYTAADLSTQANKVRGLPGRLRILGIVLLVGALVTALLMFSNAQRLLALWVLIAGVVGAVALLSAAELAQLQAIQAAVLAGQEASTSEQKAEEEDAGEVQTPDASDDHHADAMPAERQE